MVDLVILVVGIVIGVVLGLTGAGGSVLAVPLLMSFLGFSMTEAVGLSLGAVAASTIIGSVLKRRAGDIHWLPAVVFVVFGSVGSPIGSWLNRQWPENIVLAGFCLLMLVVALHMWRQASVDPESSKVLRGNSKAAENPQVVCQVRPNDSYKLAWPCTYLMVLSGLGTGILSGLFGVGGGFLIVPALLSLTNMSMRQAVSTSLFVIACISTFGFLNFVLLTGDVNISVLLLLMTGGIVGMIIGIFSSRYLAGPILQKLFSGLILIALSVTVLMGL